MKKATSFLGLFLLFLLAIPSNEKVSAVSEYEVKAAYLVNFGKFVTWPDKTFSDETDPFVIGVLGDDPFGDLMEKATVGKTCNGRPYMIKRFDHFESEKAGALKKCQILFISYSEKDSVNNILQALKNSNVMTVAEFHSFLIIGGMIAFDQVGDKINFILSPRAVEKAELKVSSKLMQIAKLYEK